MTIREGDDLDLEQVEEFHDRFDPRAFAFHREEGTYRMSSDDVMLLAFETDALVGYIAGTIDEDAASGYSMAVDKRTRRVGIGTQLIAQFARMAIEREAPTVYLRAEPVPGDSLEGLVAFYESCGFRIEGDGPIIGDADNGVDMEAAPAEVIEAISLRRPSPK